VTLLLRTPWQRGAAAGEGPVLISFTNFTPHRRADWPGIARAGLRLRRSWPQMKGAVGMWMWADATLSRGGGSVSIWESEEALMAFVRWAPHVEIMRRYRERGAIEAVSWEAERFDRAEVWREAQRLAEIPIGTAAQG
jgi:heme-degrading monooxygenase HmoA